MTEISDLIDDFRSHPCNDRERRIVNHLKSEELETYCILRNTGSTVSEALSWYEFDSRDDALKLAKPGNVLWCEGLPRAGATSRWRIADESEDLGRFWIKWQTVDAWELE